MPRDLFASARSSSSSRSSRWYTVSVSLVVHASLLITAVAVPLLATTALPTPASVLAFVAPVRPPAPPIVPLVSHARAVPTVTSAPVSTVPTLVVEAAPVSFTATVSSLPTASAGDASAIALPAAPPVATVPMIAPPVEGPIRVGGNIKPPQKIADVPPVYPTVARLARVEGTVILEATIARDGAVTDVRVLRGVAMLDEAAMAAVRQWRYLPTRLNGEPVAVLMTVTVRFTLQ